jgi:hypothetical protein
MFHCIDFTKPTNSQSHYEDIVYTEFHPNWSINVERTGRTSFTPSSKLMEPIFTNACPVTSWKKKKNSYTVFHWSPTTASSLTRVPRHSGTVSTLGVWHFSPPIIPPSVPAISGRSRCAISQASQHNLAPIGACVTRHSLLLARMSVLSKSWFPIR